MDGVQNSHETDVQTIREAEEQKYDEEDTHTHRQGKIGKREKKHKGKREKT